MLILLATKITLKLTINLGGKQGIPTIFLIRNARITIFVITLTHKHTKRLSHTYLSPTNSYLQQESVFLLYFSVNFSIFQF